MANYNIEMQYYNGGSYDVLYPNIPISAVSDWKDNVYSKEEINNLTNSGCVMSLIGTYVVSASRTNTGGSTYLSNNIYDGMFENDYDGFYFIIDYECEGGSLDYPLYVLFLDGISICPFFGLNTSKTSIVTSIPIIGKCIYMNNRKYIVTNNFYSTDGTIGDARITSIISSRNSKDYLDLMYMQEIGSSRLILQGTHKNSSFYYAECTANVSIYKYKLNLNT